MEAEGGGGTRSLPIHPGARVFPRPASFPEAGGLKGWRCDRSAGGWCRKELFASLTKRLWRLCDPVQQLGGPSASGRRSLCRRPVCEQLSGLRHPPGRASTQLRGPKRRAKPGHAPSHALLVSSQGRSREALGGHHSRICPCAQNTPAEMRLCAARALATSEWALPQGSIAKALGHCARRCPVSPGERELFFF